MSNGEIRDRAPVPTGWFVAGIVVIAVAAGIGLLEYDRLPAQVPTHWGIDGTADSFSTKTPWVVAAPLVVAGGVLVSMFAVSFANGRIPVRPLPSAGALDPQRTGQMRAAVSTLLGRLMFAITLAVSSIAVIGWLAPDAGWLIGACAIGLVAVVTLALVAFWIRWRRLTPDAGAGPDAGASEADRHWKAGVFYIDPKNPSVLVPKRIGIGWTVNLGHPVGVVVLLLLVIGVAALITWGAIAGG